MAHRPLNARLHLVCRLLGPAQGAGSLASVDNKVDGSATAPKLLIASQMALLAATTTWKSGREKLISTTPINSRGSRMRAVYWLRRPWPHMIRYAAHIVIKTRAPLATSWTFGSKR